MRIHRIDIVSKRSPRRAIKDKIHDVMLELSERLPDEMSVESEEYWGALYNEERKIAMIFHAYPSNYTHFVRVCARERMYAVKGYRVLSYFYSNTNYHMEEAAEDYRKLCELL